MESPSAQVLIVDDLPANLRLLEGILKVAGYEVTTASCGQEALDKIQTDCPDVVLLDAMMPELDGFETCRRIKSESETSWLPVVMVTALQETADRVQAIEAGADDFLTKPVDELEVVARVKSLVRVKRQREELEKSYRELRRAESMRDGLSAMIVHDLRTPLTAIMGAVETLRLSEFDEFQHDLIEICARSSNRLLTLINDLLHINKMESGEMRLLKETVRVEQLVAETIDFTLPVTGHKRTRPAGGEVEVQCQVTPETLTVYGDRDLLSRVLMNLLGNAGRFVPKNGCIRVEAHQTEDAVQFSVFDNGPGIAPEDQQRIFDKFGQLETTQEGRQMSTGLGLTFCKLAVETHGGRIWVESERGQGSTFRFTIPLKCAPAPTTDSPTL